MSDDEHILISLEVRHRSCWIRALIVPRTSE